MKIVHVRRAEYEPRRSVLQCVLLIVAQTSNLKLVSGWVSSPQHTYPLKYLLILGQLQIEIGQAIALMHINEEKCASETILQISNFQ